MRIVVAGSSGLIGSALVPVLQDGGHQVVRLVRRATSRSNEAQWDPELGRLDPDVLAGADAVIDLAGVGIGDGLPTRRRKREILTSRVRTAGLLTRTIRGMDEPPQVFIQASAVGAYGDRGSDLLTESEPFGHTFLADVVRRWEAAATPASEVTRLVLIRTGFVLSHTGGMMGRLLPLIRAGLGTRFGSGDQFWPWITLADEVRAIEHLMNSTVAGPVNLVAGALPQKQFISTVASRLGRPSILALPAAPLRLALGDFAADLLASTRAEPAVLRASGFRFSHPDVDAAVRWLTNVR